MHSPHEHVVANVHFDDLPGLHAALDSVEAYMRENPCTELDLRLHWKKVQLNPEYHGAVVARMAALRERFPFVFPFAFLPECFVDKLGITCFPHCERCPLHEANWCHWPRQFSDKYYRVPQKKIGRLDPSALSAADFDDPEPVTWFRPARADISLLARLFSQLPDLVDFGCGSGFLDRLLLDEGCTARIRGVDPFNEPELAHPRFSHGGLPELPRWALFSSLADYHVPVERCFAGETLPELAAFVVFPQVFGRGGHSTVLEASPFGVRLKSRAPLFSFAALEPMGYELLLRKPQSSPFHADCELRIYARKGSGIVLPADSAEGMAPYPWENFSSSSAISTESFA